MPGIFEELGRSKDQSLRDDVRMLGTLVGELIREQGGDEMFEFADAREELLFPGAESAGRCG